MSKSLAKKLSIFLLSIFTIHFLFVYAKSNPGNLAASLTNDSASAVLLPSEHEEAPATEDASVASDDKPGQPDYYTSLKLGSLGLSRDAYEYAMKGYNYFRSQGKLGNDHILSIVDFSLPSSKKRLFVLDLQNQKVLFNTYVSHGRNSGREVAASFSNQPESFKSSIGFYITRDTYNGKHGFSLRLDGQDKGYNDNALARAIVMHAAQYVDESIVRMQGYVGRSLGCPAVPESLHKPIIEKIKNGSCLFLYGPDKSYVTHSTVLNKAA